MALAKILNLTQYIETYEKKTAQIFEFFLFSKRKKSIYNELRVGLYIFFIIHQFTVKFFSRPDNFEPIHQRFEFPFMALLL